MAIAFDAFSAADSGSGFQGDKSWNHTPVGTPKGVLVFVVGHATLTDNVVGVTYGGVSLTEISGSPFTANNVEDSVVHVFFLGSSVPTTSPASVAVDLNEASIYNQAYCYTVTASGNTEVNNYATILNIVDDPSTTLTLGSISSFVAQAFYSGRPDVTYITELSGWTSRSEIDYGSAITGSYSYNTIGSSDVTVGYTSDTNDDVGLFAVAIKEAAGGGATDLTVADSSHSHAAENAVLTSSHLLTVADASHSHSADNLSLSTGILLALSDALHGHAADNLDLTTLSVLVVAEALHSHIADDVVLSLAGTESLVIADAAHGHAADNLSLTSQLALSIAEAAHAHTADGIVITSEHVLAVADALHAHAADNVAIFTGAIGVPANLAGVSTTATIDWSWDAVAGATGYEIEFGPDGGGYTVVDVGNNLTYEQTGLSAATLYEARVRAYIDTAANRIILESGDGYLLESGDSLLQEAA